MPIELAVPATWDNFDETAYLEANRDVAEAVRLGHVASGRQHFEENGHRENRRQRCTDLLGAGELR